MKKLLTVWILFCGFAVAQGFDYASLAKGSSEYIWETSTSSVSGESPKDLAVQIYGAVLEQDTLTALLHALGTQRWQLVGIEQNEIETIYWFMRAR